MRRSEFIVAGLLALLAVYMMAKSSELEIRYVAGEGPGGGFWPFWLAAGMLVCTVFIFKRAVQRTSPPSQSDAPLFDAYSRKMLSLVMGSLIGFVGLTYLISMYGAMFVFLFFYLRYLGQHTWATTLSIAIATPVIFFFFFDVLMRVVLPKGLAEPLFLPLYAIFL